MEEITKVEQADMDDTKKNTERNPVIDRIVYIISGLTLLLSIGMLVYCIRTLNDVSMLNKEYKKTIDESAELAITLNEIRSLQAQYGLSMDYNIEDCEYNAIAGYLYAMGDKYAGYHDPDMYTEQVRSDNEDGLGIGVVVQGRENGILITKVYQNTPAEQVGLQRFDLIVGVEDTEYTIAKYNDILSLMRGKAGDIIRLSILRDGEPMTIEVMIAEYTISSVEGKLIGDIALIDIDDFTLKSAVEFRNVMDKYKAEGIEKYIIDLRNNTGGFLDTVVDMVDYMVPEGVIVQVSDNKGNIVSEIKSDKQEFTGKAVVLTNRWTASASELFAQSMKDFGKATIIGENTYGKGTVLSTFDLSNGGAVSISTGYYLTNSGAQLEGIGVKPDIEINYENMSYGDYFTIPEESDIQLHEAIKFLS